MERTQSDHGVYNTRFSMASLRNQTWSNLRGRKLDIMIANSLHYTFSNCRIVLETLDIDPNATTANDLLVTNLNNSHTLERVTT